MCIIRQNMKKKLHCAIRRGFICITVCSCVTLWGLSSGCELMQARMRAFRSSEIEVTPVRRLGLVPTLLTQNILYRSEGMQATAIVFIHSYSHKHILVPLCENQRFILELNPVFLTLKPLNEPKSYNPVPKPYN